MTGGLPGICETGTVSQPASRLLWMATALISGVPIPVSTLIASIAMAEPMLPHNGPRTPAVEQSGTLPGAGTCG